MSDSYTLNDLDRRLANMIRIGAIKQVDLTNAVAKVEIGDIVTEWIPWSGRRAGKNRDWHAPDVGEQVVVFAPGGDFSQGVIGPSIFQDDFPANGNEATIERTTFNDGSVVEYDRDQHKLNLTLTSTATFTLAIGQSKIIVDNGQVQIFAPAGSPTKLGNSPTNHAATGEDTLTELNKIKTYLTAMAAVFSSPIPEAGMGAPSSLGTALNLAHLAAKGATIDVLQAPSATEVFVK